MTYRVLDERGRNLGEGKDLGALQERLAARVRATMARAAGELEKTGLREWSIGTLPKTFEHQLDGQRIQGFPSLVDSGDSVAVRVLATVAEQQEAMWLGTRRLLLLSVPSPVKALLGSLDNKAKLALVQAPHANATALMDDCLACAVDAIMTERGGPAWDENGFRALAEATRAELLTRLRAVVGDVARVVSVAHGIAKELEAPRAASLRPSVLDMQAQVAELVHPGFVAETSAGHLPHLVRYLKAVERRLEKLPEDPDLDAVRMQRIAAVRKEIDALPPGPGKREMRWMVEELRVSLFAQVLGTAHPVSEQRILRAIDGLRA
jgi:ATP-dependent helicase HrpA